MRSWSVLLLAIWMAMFAIQVLTNIQIAHFLVIQGVVAALFAICIAFGK